MAMAAVVKWRWRWCSGGGEAEAVYERRRQVMRLSVVRERSAEVGPPLPPPVPPLSDACVC